MGDYNREDVLVTLTKIKKYVIKFRTIDNYQLKKKSALSLKIQKIVSSSMFTEMIYYESNKQHKLILSSVKLATFLLCLYLESTHIVNKVFCLQIEYLTEKIYTNCNTLLSSSELGDLSVNHKSTNLFEMIDKLSSELIKISSKVLNITNSGNSLKNITNDHKVRVSFTNLFISYILGNLLYLETMYKIRTILDMYMFNSSNIKTELKGSLELSSKSLCALFLLLTKLDLFNTNYDVNTNNKLTQINKHKIGLYVISILKNTESIMILLKNSNTLDYLSSVLEDANTIEFCINVKEITYIKTETNKLFNKKTLNMSSIKEYASMSKISRIYNETISMSTAKSSYIKHNKQSRSLDMKNDETNIISNERKNLKSTRPDFRVDEKLACELLENKSFGMHSNHSLSKEISNPQRPIPKKFSSFNLNSQKLFNTLKSPISKLTLSSYNEFKETNDEDFFNSKPREHDIRSIYTNSVSFSSIDCCSSSDEETDLFESVLNIQNGGLNLKNTNTSSIFGKEYLQYNYRNYEIVFDDKNNVKNATLDALIERLTIHDLPTNKIFIDEFMLTFREFCTPKTLLAKLIKRFDIDAQHLDEEDYRIFVRCKQLPIRLKIYNLIKVWLKHYFSKEDKTLLGELMEFWEFKLKRFIPGIDNKLYKRILELYRKSNYQVSNNSMLNRDDNNKDSDWFNHNKLTSIDPAFLAQQLTVFEHFNYSKIHYTELLNNCSFNDSNLVKNTENIKTMTLMSTRMTQFVVNYILSHEKTKKRAKIIQYFIKICEILVKLKNFNTSMSIFCALTYSAVTRLKKTFDLLGEASVSSLNCLKKLFDNNKNYLNYRLALENTAPPALPFLGLFLSDLTFNDKGNPTFIETNIIDKNGKSYQLINFNKYVRTAKIINKLKGYQTPYCGLVMNDRIQSILRSSIFNNSNLRWNEEEMFKISLKHEPRKDN